MDAPIRVDGGLVAGTRRGAARAWLGVPYAAPPVGDLRWRAPQPVLPWSGTRRADAFAPQCLQPARDPDSVYAEYAGVQAMSEDCLTLNVFSAAPDAHARCPVMVWIHGGAFQQGAGSNPVFVQGNLPEQGVVLVTFNYRLGVFGFLAHPELGAESAHGTSGNYGLMDMIAALRWVQRHIRAFGGDPDRVTVFGQSAGAAAVVDLMASPQAEGLFCRAIAQSFGIARMDTLALAQQRGQAFVRATAGSLAALRAMDAGELLRAYVAQPERFMPIADGQVIERPVLDSFAAGRQAAVPLLAGWNADEGTAFPAAESAPIFRAALARRFPGEVDRALRLYPADDDTQARRSSRQLTGDELFAWGVWRAAAAHTRVAPTWLYHFDHHQPFAPQQSCREATPARDLGVFHSSEYPYVFGSTAVLTRDWGDDDARVTRTMQSRWLAFARGGDPNLDGHPAWPRFEDGRPTVLRLAKECASIDLPRREHLTFVDR